MQSTASYNLQSIETTKNIVKVLMKHRYIVNAKLKVINVLGKCYILNHNLRSYSFMAKQVTFLANVLKESVP